MSKSTSNQLDFQRKATIFQQKSSAQTQGLIIRFNNYTSTERSSPLSIPAMSEKVVLTASPFIISKSILKHPIRDPNSRFHIQIKQKNLHLFINKKHSELQSLFGLSSRNHAITYVTKKISEQAGVQSQIPNSEVESGGQDLDPFSRKAYQQLKEKEEEEDVDRKRKVKKTKVVTREQKIRAHVNRYMTPDIVENLYQKYKDKQREHELIRLRDSGLVDVNKLVNQNLDSVEKFEDFFLVHALRAEGLNASTLLNVPGNSLNAYNV